MSNQNTHRYQCDVPACKTGHCQPGKVCEIVDKTVIAFYVGMTKGDELNMSKADTIALKCMRDLRKMHRDN